RVLRRQPGASAGGDRVPAGVVPAHAGRFHDSGRDGGNRGIAAALGWPALSLHGQSPMSPGVAGVIHASARGGRWAGRFTRERLVRAATAMALAGRWLLGATAALPALGGFLLVAAAALAASARGDITPAALARDEPRARRVGDPLIESVLAGLPDPVVALDRR